MPAQTPNLFAHVVISAVSSEVPSLALSGTYLEKSPELTVACYFTSNDFLKVPSPKEVLQKTRTEDR